MKPLPLLLFLTVVPLITRAQSLRINPEENLYSLAAYCFTYEDRADTASVNNIIHKNWETPQKGNLNFGIVKHPQWVRFALENPSASRIERVVYIPYHHIEYIDLYAYKNDSLKKHQKAGTTRSFDNKPYASSGYPFLIQLDPGQTVTYYLRIDHRFLPLRASIFLMNEKKTHEVIQQYQALKWFWKGVMAFAFLLSIVLFFFVRTRLFLYYAVLLTGILLFVGIETGDYFLLFDRDWRNTIIDIKHIGNILVIFSFPMFLNQLSPLSQLHPRLWKFTMALVVPFGILFLLTLFNPLRESIILYMITHYAIYISAFIFFMQLVFLVSASIKKRKNATILVVIYSIYVAIFWFTNSLPNLGIIKHEQVNVYAILLISSVLEVLTFLVLIARENYMIYKDRTELIERQKNHQRDLLLATVESQENERNLVGRELHDMVGANMAVIKQKVDKENKDLRKIIHQTIETIRNLSHGLVTPQVKNEDFADEITELCILSSHDKLKIQSFFHNWEYFNAQKETTTHLYRIVQELLQNALKHSQATRIYLQFSIEGDALNLMYDDNGIGMVVNSRIKKGIGLLNVENRIKLLNGTIHYQKSDQKKGTTINMQFPV